ncbi:MULTISPECIES: hypothetical protein [unclassified Variovorax]|uniref:hypothetical protein n=1 Tax=unclassified Variovorax TaxID=663243 RepID=UPI0034E87BED
MKWLVEYQVTTATERRAQDAAARAAAARCFELTLSGAANACLKALETKSSLAN